MMKIINTIFIKQLYFLNRDRQFKIFMYKAHRSPCFQSMGKFVLKEIVIQDHWFKDESSGNGVCGVRLG